MAAPSAGPIPRRARAIRGVIARQCGPPLRARRFDRNTRFDRNRGATLTRLPVIGPRLRKRGGEVPLAPNRYVYGAHEFPLLDGGKELDAALAKHPVFDDRAAPIARAFGHRHAYLVDLR